jgi:hypothetical protein
LLTSPAAHSTRLVVLAGAAALAIAVGLAAVDGSVGIGGSSAGGAAAAPELPPPAEGEVVIAAAGDIACDRAPREHGSCVHGATADAVAADTDVSAVLALGDLQYECGELANFRQFYDPTWGRFKDLTRPVPGNHEYAVGARCEPGTARGAAGYFDYWNGVGADTGPAGDRTRGYYSYDLGAWHVIALNANCGEVGGCEADSPQGVWLQEDLAAHPSECTLAYWHQPRFSSGTHGGDEAVDGFWRLLYDAGADVVLNGHDHSYERFAPQTPDGASDPGRGIRQFVVGTGGAALRPIPREAPNSELRDAMTHGYVRMTLRSGGYDWQFVPVAGGSFTDSGTGACTARGPVFTADADARVSERSPDRNFGTSATLNVNGGAEPRVESYVGVSVSGVTGRIRNATLRLYATATSADPVAVYAAEGEWAEGEVTWAGRPPRAAAEPAVASGVDADQWVEWDVTHLVQGDGRYSFVVASESADGVTFSSREGAFAPELLVTTE